MIGSFGPIVFRTSDGFTLTPGKISRTVKGRWAKHETIGGRPQSEFLSADLSTVELEIQLRADLGVRPRAMISRLESMAEDGEVHRLIIGGKPVGRHPYKLTQLSESWNQMFRGGELFSATVSLSLEGYV